MLAIAFSYCIWEANAKTCNCQEGEHSYLWDVADGAKCSDASASLGNSVRSTKVGKVWVEENCSVLEAIAFC